MLPLPGEPAAPTPAFVCPVCSGSLANCCSPFQPYLKLACGAVVDLRLLISISVFPVAYHCRYFCLEGRERPSVMGFSWTVECRQTSDPTFALDPRGRSCLCVTARGDKLLLEGRDLCQIYFFGLFPVFVEADSSAWHVVGAP